MANESPVFTSTGSHIGGFTVKAEHGAIQVDAHDTATANFGGARKVLYRLLGVTWSSEAEALTELKKLARARGADGIINVVVGRSRVSGIAVSVEAEKQ